MDIFYKDQVNAGTLAVFTVPQAQGQANLLFFNQPAPQGTTFVPGIIISNVQYGQTSAAQFQRSLGNTIYVYSFGDEMGNLTISGLAFPRTCDDKNGLREVLEFYRNNRVAKSVARIRITFADETIDGFLVAMSMATADVSSGVHSFQLLLRSIPLAFQKRSGGSGNIFSDASTRDADAAADSSSIEGVVA